MNTQNNNAAILEMYLYETNQLVTQLEEIILEFERINYFTADGINEVFRIMHTIKGSSAMMMVSNIVELAHCLEDIFYYLREGRPKNVEYSALVDLVLQGIDFIKQEVEKMKNGEPSDGDNRKLTASCKTFLQKMQIKFVDDLSVIMKDQPEGMEAVYDNTLSSLSEGNNFFRAVIYFTEGCEMENIRAFAIIHNLKQYAKEYHYFPKNLIDNEISITDIRKNGFEVLFRTDYTYQQQQDILQQTIFLQELLLEQYDDEAVYRKAVQSKNDTRELLPDTSSNSSDINRREADNGISMHTSSLKNIISVNVDKLDKLMDLVGEMVIAEAMVIQNPDLNGLVLNNFNKAAGHLNKIINEMQDTVMSIRMLPLSPTFQRMHRIVRDMSRKLCKEINLEILGEETEVDKNIIEHINDPLMHLVRNAIDHGIEAKEDRVALGKKEEGTISIEAKNSGSDVLIIVKDDGRGLNKQKIYSKAYENGLVDRKLEEMSDKEIFGLIFLPGFSTKDDVTEFSGRGVGMDVVSKNVELIGGSLSVESHAGIGTTITIKIPLTLAIVDGMNIEVGSSIFTIPVTSVKEAFCVHEKDIIKDTEGLDMIMVRGKCYPLLKLYEIFKIDTGITDYRSGIVMMLEQEDKIICILADRLLGKQQVVVKALPKYIQEKKTKNIAGCTLLGDGSISLIIDVAGIMNLISA
ncbi:MAG TPA: chemotaxis protein CheA [Mobilitalea sp.]|nr:chemotaxis protein CheA [Mobilitalea sp.]